MEIDTVIGDATYSWKENLVYAKSEQFQLISKLNPVITNGSGQRKIEFDYNKDTGMFVCPAGHMATNKRRTGKKSLNQSLTFYFNIEKCKVCPMREGCYKEGSKSLFPQIRVCSCGNTFTFFNSVSISLMNSTRNPLTCCSSSKASFSFSKIQTTIFSAVVFIGGRVSLYNHHPKLILMSGHYFDSTIPPVDSAIVILKAIFK